MTQLALVVHFHQPVGNLDRVVQNATDRCYRPFLETLADHPELPMTLHYSGCLLEWIEANAGDVADMLRSLVERGQVELMTGGFYEPILAALPARDQVGQIRMLSDHLADRYSADATGLWLTERVWEQDVVPSIVDAGVRYTVIDDTIFHSVGITDEELKGPFVTEHAGKPLLVYAGDRNLRYLIPYKKVTRVTDYLRSGDEGRLYVYADDGEKFGEWPDTYERVYTKGWLDDFFSTLEDATDWLDLTTLGLHAADAAPVGRAYLPSSSYDEMMTWALPAEARLTVGAARRQLASDDPDGLLPFIRGAPWRAFLAKYPEVNQLQKRMLWISDEVHSGGAPEDALRELYRAQCNCAYWHGAFGGVYLSFMRSALWHHLMRAEGAMRPPAGMVLADLDADALQEALIVGSWGAAVVSTRDARLVEFDDWEIGANLLAVAARHREAYHLTDENPPGDENDDDEEMAVIHARSEVDRDSLVFDENALGGLVDLLDGRRIGEHYDYEVRDEALVFTATVDGTTVEKTLHGSETGIACTYRLEGSSSVSFTVETSALPLNLGRDTGTGELAVDRDGWRVTEAEAEVGLDVRATPGFEITEDVIETASATLEGLQTLPQGRTVGMTWTLDLVKGEPEVLEIQMRALINPEAGHKKEPGVSAL